MAITVKDICAATKATVLCGDADREFCGIYVGDLLSRAMSHVEADNIWITIMSNSNVVAVATLTEPSAVILAEDVVLADDALEGAKKNGVTVLSSPQTAYELCTVINNVMAEKGI